MSAVNTTKYLKTFTVRVRNLFSLTIDKELGHARNE